MPVPRLLQRLWDQRRRLAPLFLVLGIVVLAQPLFHGFPRERDFEILLSPELRKAEAVRVEVQQEGELLSSVLLRFGTAGVPSPLVQHPTLASGRYDVVIDLDFEDGRRITRSRVLEVPFEGVMRFRLTGRDSD